MSASPILVRTSERGALKKCEFAWDLEFNRRLRPVGPAAPALRFGSLIHKSLEKFYRPGLKRGPRPYRTFRKLYDNQVKEVWDKFRIRVDDEWEDAGELGEAMLKHYWDVYGKDEEYEVLATEQTFQVPILSPKTGKVMFYYVGTMDGVWRHRPSKKILIPDHKTAKSIDQLLKSLPKDDQAGAYWTFGVEWLLTHGLLPKGMKLHGMLFNILRKAKPDERPKNAAGQYLNQNGEVSKQQPPAYFYRHKEWRSEANRKVQRERVIAEFRRMRRIRKGLEPPIKAPSFRNCPGCPFEGPCELHEDGAGMEEMLQAGYTNWDPYSAHEIYEGR